LAVTRTSIPFQIGFKSAFSSDNVRKSRIQPWIFLNAFFPPSKLGNEKKAEPRTN
jgi:hypothetical protein